MLDVNLGDEFVVAGFFESVVGREVDPLGGSNGGLDGKAALDLGRLGDGSDDFAGLSLDFKLQPVVVLPEHECLPGEVDDFEAGNKRLPRQQAGLVDLERGVDLCRRRRSRPQHDHQQPAQRQGGKK